MKKCCAENTVFQILGIRKVLARALWSNRKHCGVGNLMKPTNAAKNCRVTSLNPSNVGNCKKSNLTPNKIFHCHLHNCFARTLASQQPPQVPNEIDSMRSFLNNKFNRIFSFRERTSARLFLPSRNESCVQQVKVFRLKKFACNQLLRTTKTSERRTRRTLQTNKRQRAGRAVHGYRSQFRVLRC